MAWQKLCCSSDVAAVNASVICCNVNGAPGCAKVTAEDVSACTIGASELCEAEGAAGEATLASGRASAPAVAC